VLESKTAGRQNKQLNTGGQMIKSKVSQGRISSFKSLVSADPDSVPICADDDVVLS